MQYSVVIALDECFGNDREMVNNSSVYSLYVKSTILVNIRGKTSDSDKESFAKETTVKNVKCHVERPSFFCTFFLELGVV